MVAFWWWPPLPAWLGSAAAWFIVLNAVVAAIAVLSSRAQPPSLASPRGVTRRASSAVLQSLRSFSIFSVPSACLPFLQLDDAARAAQEMGEPAVTTSPARPSPHPRALPLPLPPPPPPAAEEDQEEDTTGMTMDDAYAIVLASRQLPEREREEEARRSEVDAKADEFIQRFKEDLRQQRLNSIFNYTQMLKQRALAAGRRAPAAG